ncbi:MAG TPA: type II toxin-antitoxin system RelE/ParE family toxin, partial [Candidatus Limnocylindria bacterium]|nr:type II toxin-antitoxin system RelE/ParE family toxin [Candidatus Limnocylindria bacterium]
AMTEVTREGMTSARHLRGDVYELRADGLDESYRLLFAPEGRKGRILLALNAFSKRTQRTPSRMIELAEHRSPTGDQASDAYIIPDIGLAQEVI